jgi:Concanavalin A-like lectin/glucanases superfamily/Domain of unknown function (DUF2341)
MKKNYVNIFFAVFVITLLLVSSCVAGIVNTYEKNNTIRENAVITCYVSGVPQVQTISYGSGVYLKELFSQLAEANADDPASIETRQLQKTILEYAEQQGLLPVGISAEMILNRLQKQYQVFTAQKDGGDSPIYPASIGREMFCNFVATGEGAAFPIIILPRFIPFIMSPIPRLFVGWKTPIGLTSCGGLLSRTGFIAYGEQQGFALGFWGIGFSIFLPPINSYGMFGYALFAKASAEYMEYWPPNNPPELNPVYPLDGASYVPLSTTELQFHISDLDNDPMSYSVSTNPDIGGGNGNLKPDGTYTIPVSGLKSAADYTWKVTVSDGKDTTEEEFSFTTEAVAPIVSNSFPKDGDRYVPVAQGYLRFHLRDPQNDLMSYTVETSPFIGSGIGSGVSEGDIIIPITGLEVTTEYRWYVNVTDGENPTTEVFWFRTEPLMVFDPFEKGWGYRKMITVDHTMVAGDLQHFPVLIDLTDSDLRDKAQDDGDDILFMNGAEVATRLYHEIEEFDGSTGRLIAWVNVSSLSSSVDTSFYMYYGNVQSGNQQCPEKVWDSHYIGIWHMNSASGTITDSTTNKHDGIVSSMLYQSAGKIGSSIEDDGTGYVDFGNQENYETQSLTYEIWSIHDNAAHSLDGGLSKGRVFGDNSALSVQLCWHEGQSMVEVCFTDGSVNDPVDVSTDFTKWNYFVGTHDQDVGTTSLFINGYLKGSETQAGKTIDYDQSQNDFKVGGRDGGIYSFDGRVDELRISNIARSNIWILTCYQNQNYPLEFFETGVEESAP